MGASLTPLCEIAGEEGTDKGISGGTMSGRSHGYTQHYYEMWKDRKDQALVMIEIGVEEGRSIQMWRRFFPNAWIYGWDINPPRYKKGYHPKTQIEFVNTLFPVTVEIAIAKSCLHMPYTNEKPKFDFIVDDGNHRDADQQSNLDILLPYLNPHMGVYGIEDHDPIVGLDFVKVPEGYTLDIFCQQNPHHDSLLQVIRRKA